MSSRHTFRLLLLAALTAPLVLSLTACQTMSPEERRAADEQTCAGYGFRPKTDAMARCLLDLDLDRRADLRAMQVENSRMMWPPMIVERPVIIRRH